MGGYTMRCFRRRLLAGMVLSASVAGGTALAQMSTYNLGRAPSADEVRTWDISISPEGKELPPGSGTAKQGAPLYARKCAACHGATGKEGGKSGDPGRPFAPP